MTHQNRRTEKLFTVAMVAVLIGLIGIVSYYFGQTHVELVDSGWAKNANEVEPPVAAPERIDGPIFLDANNPRARHVVPPSQLIEQRTTPADGNPYLSTRKSIVSIDGFAEPMLRTEQLVTDPETGETLVDSSYEYVANQVVLFAQDPINKAKLESSLKDTHWKILDHSPNGLLVTLQAQEYTSTTVSDGISGIPELVGTAFQFGIEPNYVYHTQVIEPNDPIYESHQQWGLHNDNNDIDIDAPEGWEIENDASGVVVAIIDSGINFGHEDLIENLWVNDGETAHNGVDDDNNGYTDDVHGANTIDPLVSAEDDSGHGTHVAGILGARGNNAIGLTGVAWEIELMAVKFLGSNGKGLSKDGIEAIDYAVNNGADIINASYGGPYSKAKEQAIERARKKGIIVVAAAGNEGKRPTDEENYPAISSLDNVISVANIDWNGERSSSSNYDPTIVDVAAPGYEILSTYFDSSFAYSVQSGTSMAAPFVTGILALNRVHHPDDDYRTQIERVIASSSPRAELSNVSQSGGMVNFGQVWIWTKYSFCQKF
jgi:subtilisin family serine protease